MQVPFGVMMLAQLGVPAPFNLIHISHWICSGKNLVFVITHENKALISALLIDWFSLEKTLLEYGIGAIHLAQGVPA